MLNVTMICPGRLKEEYLRDAASEYIKRLSAFCSINVIEVAEQRLPDNPSKKQIEAALKAEGRDIAAKIPAQSLVFAMCIEGRQISSEELAEETARAAVQGKSSVTFIIGSSFGLDEEVKGAAHKKISMSKMTFPHQLARIMLLEQIYRAFQINSGGKYHK